VLKSIVAPRSTTYLARGGSAAIILLPRHREEAERVASYSQKTTARNWGGTGSKKEEGWEIISRTNSHNDAPQPVQPRHVHCGESERQKCREVERLNRIGLGEG